MRFNRQNAFVALGSLLNLLAMPMRSVHAQLAVIDVSSIAQLVQQIQLLAQQLAEARAQLLQAQTLYQSMTGSRGMQSLLSSAPANYLPTDSAGLQLAAQGQGPYGVLATGVSSASVQNAILTAGQIALLPTDQQALLLASRQNVALAQSLTQQSLLNASGRFANVGQLASAIGSTSDEKSVLELQAAIGAEQGMLIAEQTKLQVLARSVQSQQWATGQQERELVIAGHGQFATRFEPIIQ